MVQYSVIMFTTELHDKVLAVNHGDESPPLVVPLWEIGPHGNDTDETQPASDMVRLAEQYGENNCQLVISVGHIHTQQGTFWSSVSVSSRSRPNVSLEASTVKPVTIEAPLEGLTVHCDPVVSNNMPVNFTAQLSVVSPNVTFAWEVQAAANQPMLQPANSVMHSRTALSNDLFVVTFINVGQYNITVIAENGLNRIQDDVVVRVVAPIAGLSVGPKDNSRYVTLGEAITLQAVLINGSHPTFSWDLQDNMTSTLITDSALMSTVVHSFSAAGDYNVTVEATNNYNSVIAHTQKPIVVQEPVANLIVKVTGAARPGESTTVDAMVTAGSHVNFDFDFGNGRQPSSGNGQTSVTEVHSFNTAGSHAVTVYAYNQVSEIQRVAHVVVQNRVGAMTLSTYPLTPVIGHTTVFAVKLDDVVPDRTDLDYKWTLDGHLLEYTGGPLLKKIFTLSGVFNLSVMAKNQGGGREGGF
ncbi:hypothetical protein CAPTEDRAFT_217053 [Capitella teleta]|uniref:PKD domain-containing protein n=1 Tax=Capitella teleta TaxID=283909 RepID=R7UZC5_CAPTE|nr:hypothetical protein CAPTEDRAFT_217053 [Capitella teleta]|eukprot:ELU08776.1 hypothetical protein CAPTEDRAFT_217053 [Capitella teleta]